MDVHLPSGDIVEPDVLFVAQENHSIIQDWIRGVPDLVIEVLSPDGIARDRFVKRDLYARNGVREYWIVDPATRSIEVFALRSRQYEPAGYFQEGAVLTSTVLSGLSLPVTEIFE
jgi:Uma2 family endonuclease